MNYSTTNTMAIIAITALLSTTLLLSACGKTEAERCVDKQSALWDNTQGKTREENKTYWTAVENCRKKYK